MRIRKEWRRDPATAICLGDGSKRTLIQVGVLYRTPFVSVFFKEQTADTVFDISTCRTVNCLGGRRTRGLLTRKFGCYAGAWNLLGLGCLGIFFYAGDSDPFYLLS